jgi:3-oxoadipate enol-lactonase
MMFATLNGATLHYRFRAGQGRAVVFLNSLGTDFRIWDAVIDQLPAETPVLCIDKRGHGLSDGNDITMPNLVGDVAALMDHTGLTSSLICGVSVGGLIAQGLATTRPDLVSGLVLCCTGAKIGDAPMWNTRIAAVQTDGIGAMAPAILERWFSSQFRAEQPTALAIYRNMLTRTPADGYAAVCAALRDTDSTVATRTITVPTHCIAGSADLSTPPDLVRALSALIQGATFEVIADCGHLPCIEAPKTVAQAINALHKRIQ